MKTLSLMLLAAVGAAGCAKVEAENSARRGKPAIDREDAMQMIWRLPEVAAWTETVKGRPGGNVRPVCKLERTPADCEAAGDTPAWRFYFGVAAPAQTVLWNRFEVDPATGEIRVWDHVDDSYMPLVEWRRGRRDT